MPERPADLAGPDAQVDWSPSARQLERNAYRRGRNLRSLLIAVVSTVVIGGALVGGVVSSPGWDRTRDTFFNLGVAADAFPEVLAGLCELGVIDSAKDVRFVRARHLEQAYVIYDAARAPALSVIEPYLESLGVISTGRYGGWNYSSMEDALHFGLGAAERALVRT